MPGPPPPAGDIPHKNEEDPATFAGPSVPPCEFQIVADQAPGARTSNEPIEKDASTAAPGVVRRASVAEPVMTLRRCSVAAPGAAR